MQDRVSWPYSRPKAGGTVENDRLKRKLLQKLEFLLLKYRPRYVRIAAAVVRSRSGLASTDYHGWWWYAL